MPGFCAFAARRSSTTTSTGSHVLRSYSVTWYSFGPSRGMSSIPPGVLANSLCTAPSNSASAEMAESSQQLPTWPWWTSFGSTSPMILRPGMSAHPIPRPGWSGGLFTGSCSLRPS